MLIIKFLNFLICKKLYKNIIVTNISVSIYFFFNKLFLINMSDFEV